MEELRRMEELRTKFMSVVKEIGYNNFDNSQFNDEVEESYTDMIRCRNLVGKKFSKQNVRDAFTSDLICRLQAGKKISLGGF